MLELYTERCFPPDQQQQQQQQQQQPMWLCTSYEGSYGWCFNSGQKQQRRISQALVCLLGKLKTVRKSNCTDDQGALWMRRIVDTVVGPHLSRYKDVVGSLKGKASGYRLSRETAERQLVHQLTYIGCHYRIVKPVLALAVDLAYGTPMIAAPKDGPENHSSSTGLQALFDWAQTVISSETGEKQPSLHEEVLSLLFANDDHDSGGESSIEQHLLRSAPNAVTPDSAFSSPGSAMHEEAIIDIDDLRKANSKEGRWWLEKGEEVGLGISTDPHCMLLERSRLAQVLLIGYWKRLCDVELAHLLVQLSEANDPATATKGQMPFSANTVGSIRLPPPSLFDCMSAIVDLHRRHMSAKAAAENAFQKAMQSKQAALAGAEDEIAYLSSQLQSAQDQRSELTRQIQRHQETNGEIEQERKRLKTTADELTAAHKQAHADAVEWKEECVATRDLLDKSESSAARTLLDLEQLSETHGRMERKYAREQEMWATKHREMAKSNKELELALANAVARLRDVEAQADLDRSVNEELRRQNAAMAMRLSEFSKLTETLHNLSRIQN
ncbi:hypothetical protein GGI22_004868 [Coemansia erecta]|nr:hypothetical protein GGI22_004868 [Coemansia erecta]